MTRPRTLVDFFEQEVFPLLTTEVVYEGVKFTSKGSRYWRGVCPLHSGADNPTAFCIDTHTLRWSCLTRCRKRGQSVLAYLNGGRFPEAATGEYRVAVERAVAIAGLSMPPLPEPSPEEERRAEQEARAESLLEAFFLQAHGFLQDIPPSRTQAKAHLRYRGFNLDRLEDLPIGLFVNPTIMRDRLVTAGFTMDEVKASGVVADPHWVGRIVGPIRDPRRRIVNFWGWHPEKEPKYLYLKRDWQQDAVVFGLGVALGAGGGGQGDLVIVEGLFETLLLQSAGLLNVAGIGGAGNELTVKRWEDLAGLGVRRVTLALNNDGAGQRGTLDALNNAFRARTTPVVFVLPPHKLGEAKDPDDLVRSKGVEGVEFFRSVLQKERVPGVYHKARAILEKHKPGPQWTAAAQKNALDEALAFDDSVMDPEKMPDLELFFWPTLREELGVGQDIILARRVSVQDKKAKERERQGLESLLRDAGTALRAGNVQEAEAVLQDGVARLRAERRRFHAEPVRSLAGELEDHQDYLDRCRGREFIGLPQKTLPGLDEATLGLRGLMLLAAAPNVGKTALAVQLGTDVVRHNPDACFLFLSLEMSRREILTRIKCRLAGMGAETLILGSRRPGQPVHSSEEQERIRKAEQELADFGRRIRILDQRNCPQPSVDIVLDQLEKLKRYTGADRAFILVDYLQVWPIPSYERSSLRTDTERDSWRVGAMKTIRDEVEDDAVMVLSQARRTDEHCEGRWTFALPEVLGSARGSYTPDMIFLFRPLSHNELHAAHASLAGELNETDEKEMKLALEAWEERLRTENGLTLNKLRIAKGRDCVQRADLDLTFYYRRCEFQEGLPRVTPPPSPRGSRR